MNTPLAWRNVCHNKVRTAMAIAGVSFAILIIFLQLGFYGAVENTSTSVFDRLNFDLILVSPNYQWIGKPDSFPRRRLYQALSIPEVAKAVPLYLHCDKWQNAETKVKRNLLVLAFNIRDRPLKLPEVNKQIGVLRKPFTVLMDKKSLPVFGPVATGVISEINYRKIEVGGNFSLGIGFIADGTIIISDQNFIRIFKNKRLSNIGLGLLSLKKGADPKKVIKSLGSILPPDVRVLNRLEMEKLEFRYWLEVTTTGPIFGAGVLVAFIVGMVVLYQILSNEISNNLPEYATLRAMGYGDGFLSKVVLLQGLLLAVLGFIPAFGLSFGLYDLTRKATHLPIYMTYSRAGFVLGLTVLMCSISGLLSLRKVKQADPADLF